MPGSDFVQGAPVSSSWSSGSSRALSTQQSTQQAQSTSFIPNYSETPILEQIAQYAGQMAPQVYQWGMQQYANNQGNIDALMRNAQSYASPQRISSDMGMAEAGVQQSGEAARQNAIKDLQSYGIDPSSGRYAALDQASRVQTAAAAAGAGNQQRISDVATGNALQNQAIASSLQNTALGYGAATAANQFAGTGMNLKYAPLGTASSSYGQSTGQSLSTSQNTGGSSSTPSYVPNPSFNSSAIGQIGASAAGGPIRPRPDDATTAESQSVSDGATTGGFVSNSLSPSNGSKTDDIPSLLNAGEFVVPRDVTQWLGQQHFYKLMAQARKARAMAGSESGSHEMATGYGAA